jgi:4-methyl-5(b-hydroxyethyl)-thiazole monophosphate biosynthesis
MSKVLVILSTGFEEVEAVSIIDILRRAQVDVTISTINEKTTKGAHNILIEADEKLEDISNLEDFDMVVLPGGAENTFNLAKSELVKKTLQKMKSSNKYVAAICAAPYALHEAKVLNKRYTCYPSFEEKIDPATYISDEEVVTDGKVITSQGPATAMQFALELVKTIKGEEVYKEVKNGLLVSSF